MNLTGPVKLVSQVLDLPIVDKDERSCGIVDDVELVGDAGQVMRITALLVGPGAYESRMPGWMYWLVLKIAGDRIVRIPAEQVIELGAVVKLKCAAEEVGLHRSENAASRWIPRWGAL
jgi:sporulation protein YlmC with PRC-barrel domain